MVDRVIAVLDALAGGGSSPAELAQETGIARSTIYRIAAALQSHDVVQRTSAGEYLLGTRVLSWGTAAVAALPWLTTVRDVLGTLHKETGESVQFYVREGRERLCVAAVDRPTGLRETVAVGERLALNAGSGAKILLAWSDDWQQFGDIDKAELDRIRLEGTAYSIAEREVGVASVSAAVMTGPKRILGALSVSGPMQRIVPNIERLRLQAARAARCLTASWEDGDFPPGDPLTPGTETEDARDETA
ncbi:IclR family transcriptional regulator [Streptomyces sp. NBC_00448]|uniref:IclR family transcriptional regulator n=1 Tax=Streptomyces sp. NBC_00448 TaxID=2903652 RepID=UPI002E21D035